MANQQDLSSLILFDPKARTEEYKRSNHNDFATTSELKTRKFSGWRDNQLAQKYELWVLGEIVKTVTFEEVGLNPRKLEEVGNDYFGFR